ncbi:MAG: DegT/DnrJ/EryC1/StrS family aminotransferase [Candidatus Nanoarchaeia archaeon]|jgi:perosamine synthetase
MIPVFEPEIGEKEAEYVKDCLKDKWISYNGKYNARFEESFAEYCGVKYGVATTNGTTALHLALLALNIKKGDEVIVSDFTMASCLFAIQYVGAEPVFIDSCRETWNIDPKRIEGKITNRTKAIMVVHIYGHPCEMDSIMGIAKKHNLKVIEDCAEAHGAEYKGKKVGSFGNIGCFSFYANKIITTGEGGMIVTNDKALAERARWLHNLAFDKERRHIHAEIGYNFRLTNIQAAIGLAQLERIEETIAKKRQIAKTYNKYLSKVKGIITPPELSDVRNVYWMYGILIEDDFGITRDELKKELYEKGVDTRFFFWPLHKQPYLPKDKYNSKDYPVSIELSIKGLYLPSSVNLTEKEIEGICSKIINR